VTHTIRAPLASAAHTATGPAAAASLEGRLFPPEAALPSLDLARASLPAVLRPTAALAVLDATKWFGETSGGVRTYLLEKARYTERRSAYRQVLVLPGGRDAITEADGVRCYRVRGPRIPMQPPYRFLLAAGAVRRIVEHERPDVIEVGSPFLVPWIARAAARRTGVPLVCFFHSNFPGIICPFPERAAAPQRAAHRLAWCYARQLDGLFSTTIVPSAFVAAELGRAGVERTVQVPLGVDLAHFHPRRRRHAARTRRRSWLPAGPLAAFAGRLARDKELEVLLDAWRRVSRRTGAHLVLIGDGPRRAALLRRGEGHRVIWVPYVRDRESLADLLAAVDLYVAPSSVETFGLAALEALASGTPVLAADRGGVSELVTRSAAGSLFPAGDSEALADQAIALLESSLLPALGVRARAYAEREHGWDVVFDRIFGVYASVAAARRG